MPGISAVSPPISAQPACRQPSAMPATIATPTSGVELAGGEIVEEEQRLGALHDEVVDAHRDEVDADRVVDAGLDGDLELGADAVVGRDQDRVAESPAALRSNSPPKPPISASAPGRRVARTSGLIALDQGVAGIDIDARFRIGQAGSPACRSSAAGLRAKPGERKRRRGSRGFPSAGLDTSRDCRPSAS